MRMKAQNGSKGEKGPKTDEWEPKEHDGEWADHDWEHDGEWADHDWEPKEHDGEWADHDWEHDGEWADHDWEPEHDLTPYWAPEMGDWSDEDWDFWVMDWGVV